ncbi:hypothetical protein B7494_g3546 [Chlorociboria aeruginascens]|nr:hypothetical protein B7494_g3546 [Chlorociboria aeruginascens]
MSSLLTFFLGRKPTQAHLYTVVERHSDGEIEEQKDVSHGLDPAKRRKRWLYAAVMVVLWLSTAAILSRIGPTMWNLLRHSATPQWFPNVPMRDYVFDENKAFAQYPNAESNAAWDSLMPHGRGRVVIEQPWTYGLSSIEDPPLDSEEYGISVFHQLHCLGVLRYSWFALMGDQDSSIERPLHHLAPAAAIHCFDFLRQALMCQADTTIEFAKYRGRDGVVRTAHGWGVEHKCKDWDSVWEWTMKYHAHDNRTGILTDETVFPVINQATVRQILLQRQLLSVNPASLATPAKSTFIDEAHIITWREDIEFPGPCPINDIPLRDVRLSPRPASMSSTELTSVSLASKPTESTKFIHAVEGLEISPKSPPGSELCRSSRESYFKQVTNIKMPYQSQYTWLRARACQVPSDFGERQGQLIGLDVFVVTYHSNREEAQNLYSGRGLDWCQYMAERITYATFWRDNALFPGVAPPLGAQPQMSNDEGAWKPPKKDDDKEDNEQVKLLLLVNAIRVAESEQRQYV